ncbi:hypothetical protein FACS189429_5240 [Bacteroidia bacterium]|nr:hypothetical protein FACS189429_5240 [Bacteroidia bacterium]
MGKEINFWGKEREKIMQISNVETIYKENMMHFISFRININNDFLKLNTVLESEFNDFVHLSKSLQLMCQEKKNIVRFMPFQGGISIKFEMIDLSNIHVSTEIWNVLPYSCHITFKYTTDQSFLPELIDEIEMLIKDL